MNTLITIITFTYPHEANLAKAKLESEGIKTMIKDEMTAQVYNFYSNAIGRVKLQINETDIDKAIKILKSSGYIIDGNIKHIKNIEIIKKDKLININKCPFCNSDNISKVKLPNILSVLSRPEIG